MIRLCVNLIIWVATNADLFITKFLWHVTKYFLPLRRTLCDSQCLSISKINRILMELMIKIPLWGKYCIVLWSLLIVSVVAVIVIIIGGEGPVSSTSSSALHRWLVAVILQSRCAFKVVWWSLWIFSVELSSANFVKYLRLQPHDLSFSSPALLSSYLPLCVVYTFRDRIIPNGFFFPRRSPGAAKLALAWQTKELPSASPVAFLTTGNFQLLLILVFSVLSFSAFERNAFLVRRRRLWGEIKLWAVCSQMGSWLVNGAGPM